MGFLEQLHSCFDSKEIKYLFGLSMTPFYEEEAQKMGMQFLFSTLAVTCIPICTDGHLSIKSFTPKMKNCIRNCSARIIDANYLTMRKYQTRPMHYSERLKTVLFFGKPLEYKNFPHGHYDYHVRHPYLFAEDTIFPPEIISLIPVRHDYVNNDPWNPMPRNEVWQH
jgi:hypothetical protein